MSLGASARADELARTDPCSRPNRGPEEVTKRLDALIADLRTRFHAPAFEGKIQQPDVVIVAHGHILRAFVMRWIGRPLNQGVSLLLEGMSVPDLIILGRHVLTWHIAGGIGTLR